MHLINKKYFSFLQVCKDTDEITPFLDIYQRIAAAKLIRELAQERPVVIVEHDLAILDMLADTVHVGYGKPAVFGIITRPKGVRVGINQYLEGYLHEENVRFRDTQVVFEKRAHDKGSDRVDLFEIPAVDVWEVLSFYNMFYTTPQGRNHVYVCTNLSCSLRGARTMLRELESHLGIKSGQTTQDGRITLGHEECLGSCGTAPMMRVNSEYHEDLDLDEAKRILDKLE